ncbi:MAG: hypothetical protein ACRC2B_16305, partial [Rubrivivax sp.]
MKKLLHILFHPLALALFGLLALSALIWWVGPLIAIGERHPLDGLWERGIVIGLLFVLLAVIAALGAWRRKRANAAMMQELSPR